MLVGMQRKRKPLALLVGMQTGAAILENNMEVPQKIENRTTPQPSNCTTRIYPRDTKMLIQRGTCTPMFTEVLPTIAKVWKEPKCPLTDEWIKKIWCISISISIYLYIFLYIYIYIGILLGDQKRMNSCHMQ